MNFINVLIIISLFCLSQSQKKMVCEKQTEICSFIYSPVCAFFCDSENKNNCTSKTYGNICNSCSNQILPDYIIEGECKEKSNPSPQSKFTYCKDINVLATTCLPNDPVCGFSISKNEKSKDSPCSQTYNNLCEACLNTNVEYVQKGECKVKKNEKLEEEKSIPLIETSQIHPVLECNHIDYNSSLCENSEPVCGELSTLCITIRPCFNIKRNFSNICEACKNRDLLSISKGTCEINDIPLKKQTYCKNIELKLISNCNSFNPVCGYFDKSSDLYTNVSLSQTYNSLYEACSDDKVLYVESGECKQSAHQISICNEIDYNAKVCEKSHEVCGEVDIQCITTPCPRNISFSNLCDACKAENLISITEGSCEYIDLVDSSITYCKDINLSLIRCPAYSPVCGHLFDSTQIPNTYSNICEACANENIEYVVTGECPIIDPPPKDIKCTEIDMNNCDINKHNPVCAKGIDSESQVNFDNECLACNSKFAVSFNWGICDQESNLKYCKDIDLTLIDCIPYSPVCGYFIPTPTTKFAPITYNNICEACLNKSIEYVENGKCDKSPIHPIEQCNFINFNESECKNKGIVCAESEIQCITTPCNNTFIEYDNLCEACKQTNLVSISEGKCLKQKRLPKEFDCRKVNLDKCNKKKYNPVCAKRFGANDGITFDNKCVACSTKYADVYTKGPCENNINITVKEVVNNQPKVEIKP